MNKKQKTLEPLNFLQIHKMVHDEERKIHSRFPIPTTTQQDFDMRDELDKFYRKKQFYTKEQIEGLVIKIKELQSNKYTSEAEQFAYDKVLVLLGVKEDKTIRFIPENERNHKLIDVKEFEEN